MTDGPYRAGVLSVSVSLRGCKRALPPEHRVAATRELHGMGYEQWLVEGPSLPAVPESDLPEPVMLCMTQERPEGGGVRLTAYWHYAPDRSWIVGDWPDVAAFESWLARGD